MGHTMNSQFPRNCFLLFLYKMEPLVRDHPSFKTALWGGVVLKEGFHCIMVNKTSGVTPSTVKALYSATHLERPLR